MNYNIHPLLVHFPIAFLFVYSILKIFPLKRWFPSVGWREIERVILVVGVLGAFAALLTGDTAEHLTKPNHQLVEMHSTFADIATWLYCFLLIGEAIAIFNEKYSTTLKNEGLKKIFIYLEKIICNPWFSGAVAFIALIAIIVTGLLGGVMVYGTSADPVAPFVLHILGLNS